RLLFDLETDAIFIIRNEDGAILQANRAAVSLYGYSLLELLSKRNIDLSAEPELTQKATNTPLPSDQVITIPLRYHRKKDGTIFPVEITARFITWRGQSVHIVAMRDITERKKIEEELVKLSVTDPLTEIANRRYFYIQAEQIFGRTQPPNTLAVIMLDVDYFKKLNDRYGHAAGDSVLRQIAVRLQASLRPTDILARYGGEEFVILLPRTLPYEAEQVARRLWEAIYSPAFHFEGEEIFVTISVGIASSDSSTDSLDMLMRHADEALYHAKHGGRNQWVVWGNRGSEKTK
ncbi:MAG TPA: sensor domain-containing diguanylate cyclase, partial [Anaerolineales bacterium]|nr:sensor domain-containing diguanylate cyclase [Anaerolineales bacterium]